METRLYDTERVVIVGFKRIAAVCGCGRNTLTRWIRELSFPAWKQDGIWRAVPEEIKEWLMAQRKACGRESAIHPETA